LVTLVLRGTGIYTAPFNFKVNLSIKIVDMLIDLYTLKRIYAFQRIILFINFNVCIFSVLYDHTKTYILEETLLSFTQLQHFISPDLTCDEPLLNGTNPVPDSYFTALSEKQPAI